MTTALDTRTSMHIHTERPACYQPTGEPTAKAPAFKDGGKWCYMTVEEATTHNPGCFGCKRFRDADRNREAWADCI